MVSRHGKVARAPVSPRDPRVLTGLPSARAARPVTPPGRATATRAQLGELAEALLDQPTYQQRWRQNLALTRVMDWLETFPGEDWQGRWLLSGAEDQGRRWGPQDLTPALRNRLTAGLGIMIALRAVRPSYAWLPHAGDLRVGKEGPAALPDRRLGHRQVPPADRARDRSRDGRLPGPLHPGDQAGQRTGRGRRRQATVEDHRPLRPRRPALHRPMPNPQLCRA